MYRIFLIFCFLFIISTNVTADEIEPAEALTLADCMGIVLQKSSDIAYAKADIQGKNAALNSAKKDLLPTLSGRFTYARQYDYYGPYLDSKEDYHAASVSLEQPVFAGGALVTAVNMSELDIKTSDSELKRVQNKIVLDVYKAYYDYLRVQKLEDVASRSVLRLESHVKDAKAFYKEGLIPKNDLLFSELELAQGRQDLLQARHATLLAASVLNVMMKRPVDEFLAVTDITTYEKREIDWSDVNDRAKKSRPEILQADNGILQAEKAVILARAAYLPAVSVSATYQKERESPISSIFMPSSTETKTIQAVAKWQFWSWGQSRDKVFEAKREIAKAREAATQVFESIILEVRQAFLKELEAWENINVTKKAIEQAEENYRITEARYQAQLDTSTQVLDAHTLLDRAGNNYYNALYDYNLAIATLDWACGDLRM
ncbi:MAG: TolC family protein [Thermodesulfobacteriota bacterium]|nr:TolC family protein [Thermodesulfobacteriota bacterium]